MSHLLCQRRVEAGGKCRSATAIVVGSQQPTRSAITFMTPGRLRFFSIAAKSTAPVAWYTISKRATKLRHKLLPTSAPQRPAKRVLVFLASNQRPTRGGRCGIAGAAPRGTNHGCVETCPCDNLMNCPGHLGGIRGIGLRAGATFPRNCWRSSVGRASDL
jgi:hypothetical protein